MTTAHQTSVGVPQFMREVPGYLTALRIALSSCRNTTRADLIATANAPANGRAHVEAWELVSLCRRWQAEAV